MFIWYDFIQATGTSSSIHVYVSSNQLTRSQDFSKWLNCVEALSGLSLCVHFMVVTKDEIWVLLSLFTGWKVICRYLIIQVVSSKGSAIAATGSTMVLQGVFRGAAFLPITLYRLAIDWLWGVGKLKYVFTHNWQTHKGHGVVVPWSHRQPHPN